ncbi:MAG: hypothetical protein ACK5LK_04605 [Chthoniobacterales bacterium]
MQNTTPTPESKSSKPSKNAPSLPEGYRIPSILESLLKSPSILIWELNNGKAAFIIGTLVGVTLIALGLYGLIVGSFVGGEQYWIAPVKITIGSFLSLLICLPSLYIFLCRYR